MKSILTGIGVFVLLVVVLFFGAITRWTFKPREDVAVGVNVLKSYAPYIVGISAVGAMLSFLIARTKGW